MSFYGIITFFTLFLRSLYPREITRTQTRLSVGIALILSLGTFSFPLQIASVYLVQFYRVFSLFLFIHVIYHLYLADRHGQPDLKLFLTGFSFMILVAVNDILYYTTMIPTLPLTQYGLVIFIFFQAALMAMRYNRAFKENEHLNQGLEVQVEKRTNELNIAIKALEQASLTDALKGLRNRL